MSHHFCDKGLDTFSILPHVAHVAQLTFLHFENLFEILNFKFWPNRGNLKITFLFSFSLICNLGLRFATLYYHSLLVIFFSFEKCFSQIQTLLSYFLIGSFPNKNSTKRKKNVKVEFGEFRPQLWYILLMTSFIILVNNIQFYNMRYFIISAIKKIPISRKVIVCNIKNL